MSRRTIGVAALLAGTAMSALMQTMLATAAPRITAELGHLELYSWVFAAYLLGSTVTVPPCAAWADRRGRRRVFVVGALVYLALLGLLVTWLGLAHGLIGVFVALALLALAASVLEGRQHTRDEVRDAE